MDRPQTCPLRNGGKYENITGTSSSRFERAAPTKMTSSCAEHRSEPTAATAIASGTKFGWRATARRSRRRARSTSAWVRRPDRNRAGGFQQKFFPERIVEVAGNEGNGTPDPLRPRMRCAGSPVHAALLPVRHQVEDRTPVTRDDDGLPCSTSRASSVRRFLASRIDTVRMTPM